MWNFSIVFKCLPFFWSCMICMVLFMCPNECLCSVRCRANFDCCGLWWKALLCSLNLVRNSLSVCPMYIFPQSGHVNLYTPDCLYLSCSVGVWDKCFHMLLMVRKATHVCVFEQFCNEGCFLASICECAPEFVTGSGVLCLWHMADQRCVVLWYHPCLH